MQSKTSWESTPAAWELYDLEQDPTEMVNQYSNPEYSDVVIALKQQLLETREEIGDTDLQFPRIKAIFEENL